MPTPYKPGEQPSDPNWKEPVIKEWTSELLRDLEREFGSRGCWPFCLEYRRWLEEQFDEQFENPNYKSQYFDQDEFNRIRKKRGLI